MPRPSTGSIVEPKGNRKTWGLRVRFNGQREWVPLGTKAEGWNRTKAKEELKNVLAAIQLGVWEPPKKKEEAEAAATSADETFGEFANRWFEMNKHDWSERTVKDYRWALELHVLPFFAEYPLTAISIELIDQFRAAKLREADRLRRAIDAGKPERDDAGRVRRPLAPAQLNKCLKRVSQILELAVEYDRVPFNPAKGKRRKAKVPKIQRSWVEPEQAMALIEASAAYMRPVVATLIGSGLRVGEAVALEWRDVNLATRTIKVGKAKTDAGSYRELDLPLGLVDELADWKQASAGLLAKWQEGHPGESPVFLTEHGGKIRRQTEANVSRRLKTSIRRANKKLAEKHIEPIPDRVTPHSLRRTYASLRAALRDDALYVSEQMGHRDVRFTLNVYSKAVKRRSKLSGAYLAEFDRALSWAALPSSDWAQLGTEADSAGSTMAEQPRETA